MCVKIRGSGKFRGAGFDNSTRNPRDETVRFRQRVLLGKSHTYGTIRTIWERFSFKLQAKWCHWSTFNKYHQCCNLCISSESSVILPRRKRQEVSWVFSRELLVSCEVWKDIKTWINDQLFFDTFRMLVDTKFVLQSSMRATSLLIPVSRRYNTEYWYFVEIVTFSSSC